MDLPLAAKSSDENHWSNALLSSRQNLGRVRAVSLTLEQIVEKTRFGRLTEDLHTGEPELEAAWRSEVERRIRERQSGQVRGIPREEVSARIRKIIGR